MKIKASICAILLAAFSITACSKWFHSSLINNSPLTQVYAEQALPAFNKLVVTGPLHVVLTQNGTPKYHLTGPNEATSNIIAQIQDGTLYLRSMRNVPVKELPGATVYVNTGVLNALTYSGTGTLSAANMNTPAINILINSGQRINLHGPRIGLQQLTVIGPTPVSIKGVNSSLVDVHAERAADITLDGYAGLRNLDYYGPGRFTLLWANSEHIRVRSHQGQIFLAGVTRSLDAVLSGSAQLDARYLRTQNAFVNAADNARIDVTVKNKLNAFSTGSSNIYYYLTPKLLTKYMRQKGSVLELAPVKSCLAKPCDLLWPD